MPSEKIIAHLEAQYKAWDLCLYPSGRICRKGSIDIRDGCGTSGYNHKMDRIVIFVPSGNTEDLERRHGKVCIIPDCSKLEANEIELLHEMIHEMQYKELQGTTLKGRDLHKKYKTRFAGPGHDEAFFTAIARAAEALKVTPDELIKNI